MYGQLKVSRNNTLNHKLRKDNVSGVNGVYWRANRGTWGAYIRVNKKPIWLGSFPKMEDAERARKEADIEYGFRENHGKNKK